MAQLLPGLALLALAVLASSATAQVVNPVVVSWQVPYTGSHSITAQCGQGVRFDWASGEFHDLAEQYSGEPRSPITSLCSTATMLTEWQETAGGPLSYTITYNASAPNVRNFFCAVGTHCRVGGMYVTVRWPASCATASPPAPLPLSPPPPVASPPSPIASPPPPMIVASPPPSSGVAPLPMTWEWMPSVHELAPACGQSVLFSWGSGQTHQVWEQHSGEPVNASTTLCNTTTAGAVLQPITPGPASYLLAYDATKPNVRNFFCDVGGVHCTIGQMYLTIRWPASCSGSASPPVVMASPPPPQSGVVMLPWGEDGTPHRVDVTCGTKITFVFDYEKHDIRQVKPGSARYLCSQKRKPMRRLTTFQASPFTYTLTARHAGTYAFIDGFEDHCKEDGTWTIVRVMC